MTTDLASDLGYALAPIVQLCRELGVRTLHCFRTSEHAGDGTAPSFAVAFDNLDARRIAPRWVALEDGLARLLEEQ